MTDSTTRRSSSTRWAIRLHHRKINELDIGLELYSVGDRLGVVAETELGTIGLSICADNFGNSLAIGHVLARNGGRSSLSPSAWAVDADHDNAREPMASCGAMPIRNCVAYTT